MDIRNFKEDSKAAAHYLAEHGINVPHTRLLEALARAFGERNWSTLSAQLQQLKVPQGETLADNNPGAEWHPSHGPMSEAQFVAFGGLRCPYCGSKDVAADSLDADGPNVTDEASCDACGASWKTAYRVCGYFNGEAGACVSGSPTEAAPSGEAAAVPPAGCILLVQPGTFIGNLEGLVFPAKQALPVLATLLDDGALASSPEALLAAVGHDEVACIEELKQHGIAHVARAVRRSRWEMYDTLSAEAQQLGLTVVPGRADVIEELVDDVRERARRHQFALHTWNSAQECVAGSNELLDLNATAYEQYRAARTLVIGS